jgi:hypothetical protein
MLQIFTYVRYISRISQCMSLRRNWDTRGGGGQHPRGGWGWGPPNPHDLGKSLAICLLCANFHLDISLARIHNPRLNKGPSKENQREVQDSCTVLPRLKGIRHEIFYFTFFHESSSSGHMVIRLMPCRIFKVNLYH